MSAVNQCACVWGRGVRGWLQASQQCTWSWLRLCSAATMTHQSSNLCPASSLHTTCSHLAGRAVLPSTCHSTHMPSAALAGLSPPPHPPTHSPPLSTTTTTPQSANNSTSVSALMAASTAAAREAAAALHWSWLKGYEIKVAARQDWPGPGEPQHIHPCSCHCTTQHNTIQHRSVLLADGNLGHTTRVSVSVLTQHTACGKASRQAKQAGR